MGTSNLLGKSISTPPGWDASPSQVIPPQFVRFPQQFAGTHLCSWVEKGTVRVKCLAQEHNTVSLARARTWTARSGEECFNHETTTPLMFTQLSKYCQWNVNFFSSFLIGTHIITVALVTFDIVVISICTLSLLLCARSVYKSLKLAKVRKSYESVFLRAVGYFIFNYFNNNNNNNFIYPRILAQMI